MDYQNAYATILLASPETERRAVVLERLAKMGYSCITADTGVEVGIRQTRTVTGVERLTNEDVLGKRKRTDGIARCPWPIELHYGAKPKVEWLYDDYYEIPYGALVPASGENLIVAGRCLSAEHEALASARVTAQCFAYGHAAALATALSLESGRPYREIEGAEVRAALNAEGARLD